AASSPSCPRRPQRRAPGPRRRRPPPQSSEKSRRDLLLIAPSPRLCRAAGLCRTPAQRRIVLLLPPPRKLLDAAVRSRRIGRRAASKPELGGPMRARTVLAALLPFLFAAPAAEAAERHFTFGYDQPHTTAYGYTADVFAAKLKELSKGEMIIDQFPGAQLGQEPQMLQKVRTSDIDFIISATANAATLSPEAGVLSIHFIFKGEDHLKKAISDPKVVASFRKMIKDTVQGAQVLTTITLGLRDFY